MLATLKKQVKSVSRMRYLLSGKSRKIVGDYLAQSSAQDAIVSERVRGKSEIVIFDVGACECLDSIRYQRLYPNATIHAFEADSKNASLAQNMLNKHGGTRVVLNNAAVSNSVGELKFFRSAGTPDGKVNDQHWNYGNKSGSILRPDMTKIHSVWDWLRFDGGETVPCTTLDAYCRGNGIAEIDLLHLDVQGAELMVLQGAGSMLERIGAVWLEVSSEQFHVGQAVASELHHFLQSHGFSCALRSGEAPQWDELWCR